MENHPSILKILIPGLYIGNLDYKLPKGIKLVVGDFVNVPYRNKEKIGIVTEISDVSDIEESKLKEIKNKIELLPLHGNILKFIYKVADYNLALPTNVLKMVIPIKNIDNPKKEKIYYQLNNSIKLKITKERAKIFNCFKENNKEYLTVKELKELSGSSNAVITKLIQNNVLTAIKKRINKTEYKINLPALSEKQQQAAEKISSFLHQNSYQVILLEGVTGSGKTEIYFKAIAEVIEKDKQALILLPEIALTSQIIQRFKIRFGIEPATWHSSLSLKQKHDIWHKVHSGEVKVLIGARSALFLPFKALSLIVVDEEHDSSYKQDEGAVLYQARDMAILKAYIENFLVLLVSATPSLETIANVNSQKYHHIFVPSRFGKAVLPEYQIINMKNQPVKSFLSIELKKALENNFDNNNQSMLFLNRRGYAPLTICNNCGYRFLCKVCELWMVYHKKENKLKCHHCDYNLTLPKECPKCQSEQSFTACGVGVERIEEEVKKILPQSNILIMTKDTVANPQKAEEIIQQIVEGKIDIIIGTQMIAKGYHFPKLNLVGIVDADFGLLGGDLRSSEKLYQLLHQVSGRAGRVEQKGKVLIQAYDTDNPILKYLITNNQKEFINFELSTRKNTMMPPFAKLAAIIILGKSKDKVEEIAYMLAKIAPVIDDIKILGPAPAILERVRGKYRYRLLVKATKNINIQKFLRYWLDDIKIPPYIKIKVDIDPYNFF